MQHIAKLFVAVATMAWPAASDAASVGDKDEASGAIVGKVVAMLEDMAKIANVEKKEEEVSYAAFEQWCDNSIANLTEAIAESNANIETYTNQILLSEIADGKAEVANSKAKVVNATGELEEEKATRAKHHAAFQTTEKDYSESVDALKRAILALEKKSQDVPALVQIADGAQLPSKAKDMIAMFAELMADDDGDGTPAAGHAYADSIPKADVYKFQSQNLISMLEELLDRFTEDLAKLRTEEVDAQHKSDMLVQDLSFLIDTTKDELSRQQAQLTATKAKSAVATKNLAKSQEIKAADEATFSDVNTECSDKRQSFTEKQQLRTDELEALSQAIGILSREEVQNLAGVTLLQQQNTTVLAQVHTHLRDVRFLAAQAEHDGVAGIRQKLSAFLSSEAKRLRSSRLAKIAEQAGSDPFESVKILIRDLMERLLNEAHEDATHQGWCDKEMGVNQKKRESLSNRIDGLDEAIAEGSANIMAMTQESAQLSTDLANLRKNELEAKAIRAKEARQNEATMRDCKKGEDAVREAMALLKEFYSKARQATSFLQGQLKYPYMGSEEWQSLAKSTYTEHRTQADTTGFTDADGSSREGMQTFGDAYVGQQDAAGGVLAMLDVILSDFASLRLDTQASETEGQKALEKLVKATAIDMAAKTKKLDLLEEDTRNSKDEVGDATSDRKDAQDLLESALRSQEDLKKYCVDQGQPFEDRAASREAEIQSLKEALKILSYKDMASANDRAAS